ncbi:group II truncated hemoglobin [Hyphomicrobium sp. DY-1]|uniref:group II truncated hemoglobin n=1 Tax=Hyphomicrobium sp. DY-1 TaxID=3075650 RepID=UPI0039C0A662
MDAPSDCPGGATPRKTVKSLYDRLGGEKNLRALVESFYDIIEFEPTGEELHILHLRGHGVAHSRIEQFRFLSGFLGGPRLYVERYGHSDVRKMHEHVEISKTARDRWLECMAIAIDRVGLPCDVKSELMRHFTRVATMLINRS